MNASVVVPLYNEAENIDALCAEIGSAADADARIAEVILVDDGSSDDTVALARAACDRDSRFRVIALRRNFGQTSALAAGIDAAQGDVIVPMDGDLQNDPADIPKLLAKLDEGYDVVSGWRTSRRDQFFTRRLPSAIANRLISRITGVRLHDYGCTLKAYRRECLKGIRLYGEMHRFIPSLASWMGIRLAEMPVNHRLRRAGKSKYGLSRIVRVVLDLINVKFLLSYSTSPIQVFGKFGLLSFLVALIALAATVWMKLDPAQQTDMTGNPLLMLAVLLIIVGVQFISIGLLGELQIRTYYESQSKPTYAIRELYPPGAASPDATPMADQSEGAPPA